ncbi:5502_t:CDS:2, partial [Rhizophagus irregularis]
MSDNLEKDNDRENERDLTIGDCILEPIVQIINDDDYMQEMQEERTDEEVSLHSLEKKLKNIPPTRAPSTVWQHFEKICDENGNRISIKCNYCNQSYSSKSSTTTLNDHWEKKHSKVQPGGAGSIEVAFSRAQTTYAKLQGEEYLDILNNLVNWVIADCQPFRVVDNLHFKKFITSLNPRFQIPSRQTLRKKIGEKYGQYKKDIIKLFQENDSKISFTSDMWTSDTGAPYMVLTAHWIDDKWDLKHTVIAFQRFPHPNTGEQIKEATLKIFQEFSITTKASTITIDNGDNQVAGMNLLSTNLSSELQVNFNIIRCGAHTVALVVNAGLKKLQPVIDKVRAFVVEIRRSPKKEQELLDLAEKLQVNYKKLIRDVRTRWNSTYSMLESFLTNKLIITSVLSLNKDFVKLDLSESEWKEIEHFCSFLKPFFDFTEVMSGSNYPTLRTLLLLLDHLSDHITTTIYKTKIKWVKEVAQEMNDKFNSISGNLYNTSAYLAL